MILKNKLNFFLVFLSTISLINLKTVNASLQDQFREQKKCTFDNAPFQDSKDKTARYCINNENRRVTVAYDDGEKYVQEGFLGGSEKVQGFIYEWSINSNKLIQYGCPSDFGRKCQGEVKLYVEAIKR